MPEPVFPDTLPGLDIAAGLNRIGGNREKYRKLLAKFAKNQANVVADINRALGENDVVTAQRLAHTLAGVSGNIGAQALHAAAGGLETAFHDDRREEWIDAVSRVDHSLSEVLASVHIIGTAGEDRSGREGDQSAPDIAKALSLMADLTEALAAYNAKSADLFAEVKKHLPQPALSAEIAAVEGSLDQYDFDSAQAGLHRLASTLKKHHPA